jgi:hypothetical protein
MNTGIARRSAQEGLDLGKHETGNVTTTRSTMCALDK